jgi:branched-chain amino acid transport system ATP-binding protein
MLTVENVTANYGHVQALKGVSLQVEDREVVTLIGSNGAGKSTLLKTISGILKPHAGKIVFNGEAIQNLPPEKIIAKGIAHCPEGRKVFSELSVRENLEMGAYLQRSKSAVEEKINAIYQSFPILRERQNQMAGTLSGGEQQQLAIARALMLNPKMVLFDEPSLGLAPILVGLVEDILVKLKQEGHTILLVEQNANMALRVSEHAYVIETGRIILKGSSSELKRDERVMKAYLGQLGDEERQV